MREFLAIPSWDTSPTTLDVWLGALAWDDRESRVVKEDGETWVEVATLLLRGYVMIENGSVAAINFEVRDDAALGPLEQAAASLGWELHPDDDADDEDDDDPRT